MYSLWDGGSPSVVVMPSSDLEYREMLAPDFDPDHCVILRTLNNWYATWIDYLCLPDKACVYWQKSPDDLILF